MPIYFSAEKVARNNYLLPFQLKSRWAPFILYFAYLPLGYVLNLCTFDTGVRALGGSPAIRVASYFVIYAFFVHFILVWPMTAFVYPQYRDKWVLPLRSLAVFLLLAAPLASFSYYLGTFREPLHYFEAALSVFPACLIAILYYEKAQRGWVFSLVLSLFSFIPLMVTNDLLGPFPVFWNYATTDGGFYFLRVLSPLVALWVMIFLTRDSKPTRLNFSYGLIILASVLCGVRFWDFEWLVFLFLAFFLTQKSQAMRYLSLVICLLQILMTATRLVVYLRLLDTTLWALVSFAAQFSSLALLIWISLFLLKKPGTRS